MFFILNIKSLEVIIIMDFYCVKCRNKKQTDEFEEVTTKNNRKAAKSKCPDCGTGMYRIMGKA